MIMKKFKTYVHTLLIYPLIFMFSYLLKGKKVKYKSFCQDSFKDSKNENILIIRNVPVKRVSTSSLQHPRYSTK